jgi:hypothetical protein
MATVGSLFINVKARTASFRKKMGKVGATIKRLSVGFLNIAKKVAMFGAAITAVAVVAIVALTKKGLAAVDTLAKLAQNIGATVASLQIMRHMATLGGVAIEKMDKSIAKMVRGIGEAAIFSTGEAADALRELGLSATSLEKLSPEKMFGKIADAINKVGNEARQGILAYKIFGRSGQELIVTMKGGSKSIAEMTKKMQQLGVLVSDKHSQMVEKANDAWADIAVVWDGLSKQLAVEFAPVLTLVAEKMLQFVKNAGGMGVVAEYVVLAIAKIGAAAWNMLLKVTKHWYEFKAAIFQVLSDLYGVLGQLGVYDLAEEMADQLQRLAVENIFKAEDFIPIDDIDEKMRQLKDRMMGMGFDPASGKLEISGDVAAPNLSNTINSLQTAIGQFKVEGDTRDRWLGNLVSIETASLKTSRDILAELKDNGGALV